MTQDRTAGGEGRSPIFDDMDPHAHMLDIVLSGMRNQVVVCAARLDLAGHLADATRTADDVAAAGGLDPDATFRFLRACASFGLTTYDPVRGFAATPLLDTLRTDDPASLRDTVISQLGRGFELPRSRMTEAVRTGRPQAVSTLGSGLWDFYASPAGAAEGRAFAQTMRLLSDALVAEAVQRIDTRGVHRAVDVGGGTGTLLQALMQADPDLRGTVLDTADVARAAEDRAAALGIGERFEAVAGDFLVNVPAGDLLLLKFILHDWPVDACRTILRNCRRALPPGGRLVVIELLLDSGTPNAFAATMDLGMLTVLGGRERSDAEYRALLAEAGFRVVRTLPTTSTPYSILEAEPEAQGTSG